MSLDSKVTASLQMSFQSDHGTDNFKCKYTLTKPHQIWFYFFFNLVKETMPRISALLVTDTRASVFQKEDELHFYTCLCVGTTDKANMNEKAVTSSQLLRSSIFNLLCINQLSLSKQKYQPHSQVIKQQSSLRLIKMQIENRTTEAP